MIPTLIVFGLGLGLIPRHWKRRVPTTITLPVLAALAWGSLVGAPFGGTLLALVNIAAGIPLGLGIQKLGSAARRRAAHAQGARRRGAR